MNATYKITATVEVPNFVDPDTLAHELGNRLLVEDDDLQVVLVGDAVATLVTD